MEAKTANLPNSTLKLTSALEAADRNLAAAILLRSRAAPQGRQVVTEDLICFTLGVDAMDGHLNGVLCLGAPDPEQVLSAARDFFDPDRRGYVIWVRDHHPQDLKLEALLRRQGKEPVRAPGSAGMQIQTPMTPLAPPEGHHLQIVQDQQDLKAYRKVIQDAFDKPAELCDVMYAREAALIQENVRALVLYKGTEPVGAATTVRDGDTAGIYYVGTIKEAQGKGIGACLTTAATNLGFEMGAKTVILQASLAGEPLYERLGYRTLTRYRWYKMNESFKKEATP